MVIKTRNIIKYLPIVIELKFWVGHVTHYIYNLEMFIPPDVKCPL